MLTYHVWNNLFLKCFGIFIDYGNWKFTIEKSKLKKLYFIRSLKSKILNISQHSDNTEN